MYCVVCDIRYGIKCFVFNEKCTIFNEIKAISNRWQETFWEIKCTSSKLATNRFPLEEEQKDISADNKRGEANFIALLGKYFSNMVNCISPSLTSTIILARVISSGQRAKRYFLLGTKEVAMFGHCQVSFAQKVQVFQICLKGTRGVVKITRFL